MLNKQEKKREKRKSMICLCNLILSLFKEPQQVVLSFKRNHRRESKLIVYNDVRINYLFLRESGDYFIT